jgi:hypothetical protein
VTIDWQAPGVRRWIWIAAGVVVCWVAGGAVRMLRERNPLPEKVAEEVERHAATTLVDTTEIHRLERVAAQAQVQEQAAIAKARESDTIAARALNWPARGVELPQVQALAMASADKDTAVAWARVEALSLDTALARSEARAAQGDSALEAVRNLAEAREEPCRVLWVVPCPTRVAVMAATAAGVAAALWRR